eukprot:TRINITY_DN1386_c0_g1_i12.p3 TRINITY_DN1386_c0_g1~~TRINITY_DN1386_c0_g1_i12.p3  ORF type:complete len:129 (-),score=10.74 TRINITY_DN1386_c0_g1_i12:742-1128(-)
MKVPMELSRMADRTGTVVDSVAEVAEMQRAMGMRTASFRNSKKAILRSFASASHATSLSVCPTMQNGFPSLSNIWCGVSCTAEALRSKVIKYANKAADTGSARTKVSKYANKAADTGSARTNLRNSNA